MGISMCQGLDYEETRKSSVLKWKYIFNINLSRWSLFKVYLLVVIDIPIFTLLLPWHGIQIIIMSQLFNIKLNVKILWEEL